MSSSAMRFLGGISLALGACLTFGIAALAQTGNEPWNAQGIINTSASPKAKLHSVPIRAVAMGDGFWSERMRTNAEKSIPTLLGLLEEHGVVDNFRRLSGRANAGRKGPLYTDSDLYKWMEAVAFVLQSGGRPQLRETLDKLIDEVLAAQEPSKAPFLRIDPHQQMVRLGQLLEGGNPHHPRPGNRNLLDGGIKYADYV